MKVVEFYKVKQLPPVGRPNAFYYVDGAEYINGYLTDTSGNPKPVGSVSMIVDILNLSGYKEAAQQYAEAAGTHAGLSDASAYQAAQSEANVIAKYNIILDKTEFVEFHAADFDQRVADAKLELDAYVDNPLKILLDSYTTTKQVQLDNHTLAKEVQLDDYTGLKAGELDSHTTTKKAELDTYVNTDSKPSVNTYVASKIVSDIDPEIAKAATWAEGTNEQVAAIGGTRSSEGWAAQAKWRAEQAETQAGIAQGAYDSVQPHLANIGTVATNIDDINTVAGINAEVSAVNANKTNIDAVAVNEVNINKTANNEANINEVANLELKEVETGIAVEVELITIQELKVQLDALI